MKLKRGMRRSRSQRKAHCPSTYIQSMDEIKPGTKVWLWCRVSSGLQDANGNNADQEVELLTAVEGLGGIVVGVTAHAGKVSEAEAQLCKVANMASRSDAVLLAESTSRFVRHPNYHPKLRPHLVAGANILRDLCWVCGDVTLVTMLDPDAKWQDERAHQSKRGQLQKGNRGGRPTKPIPGYKKRCQGLMLSKVFWLSKTGFSVRDIAAMLKQHTTQIQRWRNKLRGR